MYCRDLKQTLDEFVMSEKGQGILNVGEPFFEGKIVPLENALKMFKNSPLIDYPKQENEHNALADARWNKRLFDFLKKL